MVKEYSNQTMTFKKKATLKNDEGGEFNYDVFDIL
jgi:hypothetical protein